MGANGKTTSTNNLPKFQGRSKVRKNVDTTRLKDISEDYLQIEEVSLYPALQRMLKTSWLETEMGLSAKNRPVRIFKVTKAGRKHLEQELASVEKMFAGITRVLILAEQEGGRMGLIRQLLPVAVIMMSSLNRFASTSTKTSRRCLPQSDFWQRSLRYDVLL
jgi:hypothetical protein